jgi:hypothetical protein
LDEEDTLRRGRRRTTKRASAGMIVSCRRFAPVEYYCSSICIARV